MKVFFDVSRALEPQLTGIGVYQKELFENLKALDGNSYNIVPVYYGRNKDLMTKQIDGIEVFGLYNPYYFSLRNRLYDYFFLKPKLEKFKNYLFHSTAYRCITGIEDRTIMTIHDLIFIRDKFHYNKLYHNIVKYYLPKVRAIIVVSYYTKKEMLGLFPQLSNKQIYVIYQGVRDKIFKIDDVSLVQYKKKLIGGEGEYILFLGAIAKRKNIARIIKAYNLLKQKKLVGKTKLVIAGKPLDDYDNVRYLVSELGLSGNIILKNYIAFEEIPFILSAAKVFVFPSLYEGFGLPVLEAMKCGVPVVTSNTTSLGELFADSAITVDPLSVDEIADGIYKLLYDEELRKKYIKLGFEKAKEFTWEKTAQATMKVYEELI